jgi:hypothetical protein
MGVPNVQIIKRNGALGRRNPNTDGVCALITTGVAVSGKLVLGTVYPLRSTRDAIALGITEAYDAANKVLVYHPIDRFFKRNPNGTLYIQVNAQTNTLEDLCDVSKEFAKKVLRDLKGIVKFVGVTHNPATGYTPTLTTGLDADVIAAIPKAQALYEDEFSKFRMASFLIEGRSFNGTAAAALDLRTLNAANVSVTIAQDPDVAALETEYAGYAAVGDVLGLISKAAVSQNIGEYQPDFNLNNTGLNLFVTAALSSGSDINSYADADLDTLDDKGYIFPIAVAGLDGFYLNDSHTASALLNNDYAYIENNRTIEKAVFLARQALLPRVKSRVQVDSATGQLAPEDVKTLETIGKRALAGMETDGDVSGGIDCYVDPEQDIIATSRIDVEVSFIPVSIARQITLSIGFVNPFKAQ